MSVDWITVEARDRWDAVALLHRFVDRRSFLVELDDHFDVCVTPPGGAERVPEELLPRIEGWLRERSLPSATLHLGDGSSLEIEASCVEAESGRAASPQYRATSPTVPVRPERSIVSAAASKRA